MILEISGIIYEGSLDTKIQKFTCNTSRDIIRNFSTVASEDSLDVKIVVVDATTENTCKSSTSSLCMGFVMDMS